MTTMDARILRHPDQVPVITIPTDKLMRLSADPVALRVYIDAYRAEGKEPSTSTLQRAYQQALSQLHTKAPIDPELLKVQHQPKPSFPTYSAGPVKHQWATASIQLTPEQRAANEIIRQEQYAAQMRAVEAAKAAAEIADCPALAA